MEFIMDPMSYAMFCLISCNLYRTIALFFQISCTQLHHPILWPITIVMPLILYALVYHGYFQNQLMLILYYLQSKYLVLLSNNFIHRTCDDLYYHNLIHILWLVLLIPHYLLTVFLSYTNQSMLLLISDLMHVWQYWLILQVILSYLLTKVYSLAIQFLKVLQVCLNIVYMYMLVTNILYLVPILWL